MISIFRDIIQNEGPANLYRGVWSPVMAEAPKRAIKFSLNAVGAQSVPCFVFFVVSRACLLFMRGPISEHVHT